MVMITPKKFSTSFWILFLLFWAALAAGGLFALSRDGSFNAERNHALIIGISHYDHWSGLKSPARDAREIARILMDKYDFKKKNVVLLTDETKEKPTRNTILKHIENFKATLTDQDNLLVFFSGQSAEDDRGHTYWIPRDGDKTARMTWLRHADLCKEFFAAPDFRAKAVSIITDSVFSRKLFRPSAIELSPYDLRYSEKIREKAQRKSREVLAFGDQHWPASRRTGGFGLFAYYIRRALENNWLKVIDLENLIFTEKTIFETSRIAGTRLLRGRLRNTEMDRGGQFIITRLISPPVVDVVDINVSPEKGYQGDRFIFQARTGGSAYEVAVEINGRQYPMEGAGTHWKQTIKVASLGTTRFRIVARNSDDVEGKPMKGRVTTMKRVANLVDVTEARVTPKKGWGGNVFHFRAKTDKPAQKVTLLLKGRRFEMEGSGTKWYLRKTVEDVGTLDFSVVATNPDGAQGRSSGGIFVVKAPLVDIIDVAAAPARGYAGDKFQITAKAERPAASVVVRVDGVTYPMTGSGTDWRFSKTIQRAGKKRFVVIARNIEGAEGLPKSAEIVALKRPVVIPNIAEVSINPGRPFTDQTVAFQVRTTTPANEVYVEIGGKKHLMEGMGTEWKYLTRIATAGPAAYSVVAKNRDGVPGTPSTGRFTVRERLLPVPGVAEITISPDRPHAGETFAVLARTSAPADSVYIEIQGKRYRMTGKGTEWKYLTRIPGAGPARFTVIARAKDGSEGPAGKKSVMIAGRLKKAVDVVEAEVRPKEGYAGQTYLFKATTNIPARDVNVVIQGKRYPMTGSGTRWSLKKKIRKLGTVDYAIIARNPKGEEGNSKIGTLRIKARPVRVARIRTTPKTGYAGDEFTVTAKTDYPASAVFLEMDGVVYPMKGKGQSWQFVRKIQKKGKKKFTVIAKNTEGLESPPVTGELFARERVIAIPDVVSVDVNVRPPGKGYVGDTYAFRVRTAQPAEEVYVEIEGKKFAMKGAGTQWSYDTKIDRPGKSRYTVVALNREGQQGASRSGTISARERPLAIPDVASVDVRVLRPGEGYVGDSYIIKANTSRPAEKVYVEIEGKRFAMEGAGTEWKYVTRIDKLGTSRYRVVALNRKEQHGRVKEGEIKTARRPMALVNIAKVTVSPEKGYAGGKFTFTATTDGPAESVDLVIGKDRYPMTGSGTSWTLSRTIGKPGTLVFYAVARNTAGKEGGSKTAELAVAELRERYRTNPDGTITDKITGKTRKRFVDNGDGTVTDLATNLMWLKSPKQIAVTYEKAVEYCQGLKIKSYEGWRLPTLAEWKAIIDKNRRNPSLPPNNPFVNVQTRTGYWSKTRHKFGPLYVYQISLWYGKTGFLSKKKYANVWPVRYAELSK